MIQRIQTVYFIAIILIAAVSCGGALINSHQMTAGLVTDYIINGIYFKKYENGVIVSSEIQYINIALISLVIGWTLNIILGFKNRVKQMRDTKINFVFIAALIIAINVKAFVSIPEFDFSSLTVKSVMGMALLIFMLYLNLRALLLIRRDENLVRSADRIR